MVKKKLTLEKNKIINKHTFQWIFLCIGVKHINLDYRYNLLSGVGTIALCYGLLIRLASYISDFVDVVYPYGSSDTATTWKRNFITC